MKMIYPEESYAIQGALFEVYRELGAGFLESVYQEALTREFALRGLPAVSQPKLEIHYKGELLTQHFEADFVCYSKIIIEIKSCKRLDDIHRAQTQNYLRATGFQLAILANFGNSPKLEYERIVK